MKFSNFTTLVGLIPVVITLAITVFLIIWGKTSPTAPGYSQSNQSANTEPATPPQTNSEGSVEVTVTPSNLDPTAETWTFSVSLNTHSVELVDDLSQQAFLVTTGGGEEPALSWTGDPPGGHHRQGTLKFKKTRTRPKDIVLLLKNVNGIAERRFVWSYP